MTMRTTIVNAALACAALCGAAAGGDAVAPGELVVEPPTLICLGFEWRVAGDDNRNAAAAVRYRRKGDDDWRDGLPLCPISYATVAGPGGTKRREPRTVRGFAGSILDIEPGTAWEVTLTLTDPDGVDGEATRRLALATRAAPAVPGSAPVRHVYPPDHAGNSERPAYKSLMHAVNGYHTWCDEMQTVHPDAAPPGTVIKVHAGTYNIDRFNYRDPTQLWLNGTYVFVADGTPEKPIYVVAAGDGEAIIDGAGCHTLFDITAADYLHFAGLTIRNCCIAFQCGFQGTQGCTGLAVENCWIENIAYGVHAQDSRSKNFYIADNVFVGSNPAATFNPRSGGAWGKTAAGYAVNLSGAGHVVCHNYAANFWDGLNVFTGAIADPYYGQQARAIDFYNNEVFNSTDNFIEADGGFANIRILRNRCFNCMAVPLSVQPVYVGPVYWIRNISFNAAAGRKAFKLCSGSNVLAYHNTVTGHPTMHYCDRVDYRNNAFMGAAGPCGRGGPRVAVHCAGGPGDRLAYNAHRVAPGGETVFRVGPPDGAKSFSSLAAMAAATGFGARSVAVPDYGVFVDAPEPDHAVKKKDSPLVRIDSVDLRPAAGSPLVDAGCWIPAVNDDFTGDAPDIGACERGRPLPRYGPRTKRYHKRLAALRHLRYRVTAPPPAAGGEGAHVPSAGRPVSAVVAADGAVERFAAGKYMVSRAALVTGTARSDMVEKGLAGIGDFDLKTGMTTSGGRRVVVDVVDFGGAAWRDTNGPAPDFFIFEAGGNDAVFVAPLLPGGAVGRLAAIRKGPWGDTGIATPLGAGSAHGVALEVAELLDAKGMPLDRGTKLRGLRIVGDPGGMDLISVSARRSSR